jgi:hypothetical protein
VPAVDPVSRAPSSSEAGAWASVPCDHGLRGRRGERRLACRHFVMSR